MKVSVIIPALNEEAAIALALKSASGAFEVIVADGGSTDKTREVSSRLGALIVRCGAGRGLQMDSGAAASRGDVLLFLHADTALPSGWPEAVKRALADNGVVAGAFSFSIDSPSFSMRAVAAGANARARVLGLVYGDQALFARREEFFLSGGFRNLPLMEDVDCVKRLKKRGRFVILRERAVTSWRRWSRLGVLRSTIRNWSVLLRYLLGVPPEKLYASYYANYHVRR